jgi:hypothetical protein
MDSSGLEGFTQLRLKARHWVKKNVDDSQLRNEDRAYVEDVICDILLFDKTVPELKITIKLIGNHYTCLFRGWKSRIPFKEFSDKFLDKERRDHKYDYILSDGEVTPEQDGEGGPYVTIRIQTGASSGGVSDKKRR